MKKHDDIEMSPYFLVAWTSEPTFVMVYI